MLIGRKAEDVIMILNVYIINHFVIINHKSHKKSKTNKVTNNYDMLCDYTSNIYSLGFFKYVNACI